MAEQNRIPLNFHEFPVDEMRQRAADFRAEMQRRRSVRAFSGRAVPREIVEQAILAAGSAPSGANMQPWQFVVVGSPDVKHQIREQAEAHERAFYEGRAGEEWLDALSPLATNWQKPFLEEAPYLIAVFAKPYGIGRDGERIKHYYVKESVGLATGVLVAALHHAGLATLTYTPSPMTFLSDVLNRPENERPFLVVVAGYPADGVTVPDVSRKSLDEIAEFV